jgi:serine/threonine protein kinase
LLAAKRWKNLIGEVESMNAVIAHDHVTRIYSVEWDCSYPKKDGTIMVCLKHIFVFIDIFQGCVMIVMEIAMGGTFLDFLLYTGAFPEDIARAFFRQLVTGLMHCHSVGVYHRDLKPENLLLDNFFSLKVRQPFLEAYLVHLCRLRILACLH